ncbi:cyclin-dependent kinase F-4-like [Rutidosis leptorrhynchoides]|uniref:cyclin-dependent kinase F-4-like n=1 Tax=Rutidosis leptorrhynchoides TaxID=125765 RepID=UPI003A98EE1F
MEKYEFVEELGRGLFGVVYQGVEKSSGRRHKKVVLSTISRPLTHSRYGFIHRDSKSGNLLISRDMVVVKSADFGLAREIIPRDSDHHTNCITHRAKTTLWYRAPEALLNSTTCGPEVDMWAMGVIMAELFNLSLMFPGQSEDNQMLRICQVIGSPSRDTWPEGIELAKAKGFQFPECNAKSFREMIPSASEEAIDLIGSLLSWNPRKRPTALEALQHPFLSRYYTRFAPTFRATSNLERRNWLTRKWAKTC